MFRAHVSVALVCALAGPALAAPRARLVLADPDPELARALVDRLRPREIDVVVDPDAVHDERDAAARATRADARYVVWRADDTLVVFDRNGAVDRRATAMGPLGPTAAGATARTTIALLHLPERDLAGGLQLRAELGGAARFAARDVRPRFVAGLALRPSRALGLRLGLSDEFGAVTKITRGTFVGNASDHEAGVLASWAFQITDHVAIEPFVIAGVAHATLTGLDVDVPRSASAWLPTFAGGVWLRPRVNAITFALGAAVRSIPTAPTDPTGLTVSLPRLALVVGLTVGVELGR